MGSDYRVVIIEDASRFARDLMTQELGILSLQSPARSPGSGRAALAREGG